MNEALPSPNQLQPLLGGPTCHVGQENPTQPLHIGSLPPNLLLQPPQMPAQPPIGHLQPLLDAAQPPFTRTLPSTINSQPFNYNMGPSLDAQPAIDFPLQQQGNTIPINLEHNIENAQQGLGTEEHAKQHDNL